MRNPVLAFLIFIFLPAPGEAASVLPADLGQLHDHAEHIFLGRCLDNSVQRDVVSGRIVTYTTFQVLRSLKGSQPAAYSIKQIGGILPGDEGGLLVPGVPQFQAGARYLLFLPRPSRSGFSSPVGLGQGSFSVVSDEGGDEVTNGRDLAELLGDTDRSRVPRSILDRIERPRAGRNGRRATRRTRAPLDDFIGLVRGMRTTR